MAQLTIRVEDGLVPHLKEAARAHGLSLNRWATAVLSAAVDPALAGSEAEQLRERLQRAGLLMPPGGPGPGRPPKTELERARIAAGRGRPLSDFVREGRG